MKLKHEIKHVLENYWFSWSSSINTETLIAAPWRFKKRDVSTPVEMNSFAFASIQSRDDARSADDPRKKMMKNSRPFFLKGLPSPSSLVCPSLREKRREKSRDDPRTTEEERKKERKGARAQGARVRGRHRETFKNIQERERGHFEKPSEGWNLHKWGGKD